MRQTILIRAVAPAKPVPGAACNGCGVCCAAEPCPVGRLLPGNRTGPCRALVWEAADGRYWCGLVRNPSDHLRWLSARLAPWVSRVLARRIAAGRGCDSDAEVAD